MTRKVWQERAALELLDEAPFAYKPLEQVMNDANLLVEPVEVLTQFINYKGVGRIRNARGRPKAGQRARGGGRR
jgi:hypothetical protein